MIALSCSLGHRQDGPLYIFNLTVRLYFCQFDSIQFRLVGCDTQILFYRSNHVCSARHDTEMLNCHYTKEALG